MDMKKANSRIMPVHDPENKNKHHQNGKTQKQQLT